MVKRWVIDTSCECGRFGDDINAWEDKNGEWVRYEDIKNLLQNTSSNGDYIQCQHEYEYVDTALDFYKQCKKCGAILYYA